MQLPLLVAVALAAVVPLHRPAPRALSLLARRQTVAEFKAARENNTHATEYYGTVTVGGQELRVLFDTGSDALIVPGVECDSAACKTHAHYDAARSPTANESGEPRAVAFGAGNAAGVERNDVVCLDGACGRAGFLEVLEESDDPFLHAGFDGVMGLSLPLRKNATDRDSVVSALVADKALPAPVFAAALGGPSPRMEFSDAPRDWPGVVWANVSEPGYWQLSLSSISVGGKELEVCRPAAAGANITTFFGKMCCRTVEEFEHEERCQYAAGGKRSRYATEGVVLATYQDGRVAVRMEDGCVQKVPAVWVSTMEGCRGDGTIQAVVDTGMSLMTAPPPLAAHLLASLGVPENCTGKSAFPDLALRLPGGQTLTLTPEQYMDRVELVDGSYCWAHVMPMPATAKGPVVVLGLPFLRAYSTVFDAENQRLGFLAYEAPAEQSKNVVRVEKPSVIGAGGWRKALVRLHGRRGSQDV